MRYALVDGGFWAPSLEEADDHLELWPARAFHLSLHATSPPFQNEGVLSFGWQLFYCQPLESLGQLGEAGHLTMEAYGEMARPGCSQ